MKKGSKLRKFFDVFIWTLYVHLFFSSKPYDIYVVRYIAHSHSHSSQHIGHRIAIDRVLRWFKKGIPIGFDWLRTQPCLTNPLLTEYLGASSRYQPGHRTTKTSQWTVPPWYQSAKLYIHVQSILQNSYWVSSDHMPVEPWTFTTKASFRTTDSVNPLRDSNESNSPTLYTPFLLSSAGLNSIFTGTHTHTLWTSLPYYICIYTQFHFTYNKLLNLLGIAVLWQKKNGKKKKDLLKVHSADVVAFLWFMNFLLYSTVQFCRTLSSYQIW